METSEATSKSCSTQDGTDSEDWGMFACAYSEKKEAELVSQVRR